MHVKSHISCLLFRAYIGGLYNGLFMNTGTNISRSNIHVQEQRIKYLLSYFNTWWEMREIRKADINCYHNKVWDKSIMSTITLYNMHLAVIGFLEYSRHMLNHVPDLLFVLMTHSNQSSLEAHFSLMHFYGTDSPATYEGNMNIVDNEKSMGLPKCNNMYESNTKHYVSTGRLTGSRSNEREKTILDNLSVSDSNDLIYTFDISMDGNNIGKLKDLWGSIKSSCIYGSYKLHMVEYTEIYQSFCLKTKTEKYVMSFLRSTCKTEEVQVNRTCHKIMTNFSHAWILQYMLPEAT